MPIELGRRPSVRENAERKGRRYVLEGRLRVLWMDDREIRAECRGGGEVYRLGSSPAGWWCSCPAVGRCAHLTALLLVADRPQVRRWAEAAT